MRELLTERAVLTTFAGVAVLLLFVMLYRARRVSTSMEDATLHALHLMCVTAPELRKGLTQIAADQAAPNLRELLKCVAVGIVDREGTLLSWDGGDSHHYEDLVPAIARVISTGESEYLQHKNLPCDYRHCAMRNAVIEPLTVEDEPVGALVVLAMTSGRRLIRAADEAAHYITAQLELAELQVSRERLAIAEVRALRAQISPHFIYNALNTISSLIRTDPEQARELLQEFAEFTRYSFQTANEFTTLADELRNIDRYLTLERARYGPDRVNVRLKIAPEVLPVVVPFLVLQPLVENAVRHGLASKPGGGTVSVVAEDNGAEALISVEDDGIGMNPDRLMENLANAHLTGAHVGLGNIDHRMRAAFGNDYSLVVETDEGAGTKVILRVPKFSPGVRQIVGIYSEDEPEVESLVGKVAVGE